MTSGAHCDVGHPHKRNLYEEVYERIRNAISAGDLTNGMVLTEAPLAEIFGSSRAPVRQALRLLARDGLVSRFDGRGYLVGDGSTAALRVDLGQVLRDLMPSPERPTLAWKALYEDVERIVVYHSFFGTARLVENELASHYGVGRSVARDVAVHLEAKGIVEKDERFRWSVVPLDERRITDLFCLREYLEAGALSRATNFVPANQIARMMARLKDAMERYPDVSSGLMYDLEVDLHVRILEHCPNKELLHALQRAHSVQTLSKHVLGVQIAMPAHEPFLESHMEVFRLIERRDGEAAGRAVTGHIRASLPKVLDRAAAFRHNYTPELCPFVG